MYRNTCLIIIVLKLMMINKFILCQSWNMSDGILPWEAYIDLGDIQRPLGLLLNTSSLAHHHFAIGYTCLHSFMYDEAQQAFDLAISINPTFIEAYLGKMLACKHALWKYTDFDCGLNVYNNISSLLNTYHLVLSPFQIYLVSTVYQWYSNQSSIIDGELAFLTSIANLSRIYSDENDIRVLWGLSLLNVAHHTEYEKEIESAPLLQARKILEIALKNEPHHPGALLYLIHAYDTNKIDSIDKASDYAEMYNRTILKLSYAQHMPSRVWIRTGAWLHAISSDDAAIRASLSLCAIKLLGHDVNLPSIELNTSLSLFNTTEKMSKFLQCDAANRARSMEWLSYSRLQTGDWSGCVSLINDLLVSVNKSSNVSNYYLSSAYRAQAHAIIDLFYWFPYTTDFLNKIETSSIPIEIQSFDDNVTSSFVLWSEAGYRFADCLKLLTTYHKSNSADLLTTIDNHLSRLSVLSSGMNLENKYIVNSIKIMILQITGMRYFVNESFQECLNELNTAVEIELKLMYINHSPKLVFAHSSELLATHLLLIYDKYQAKTNKNNYISYVLNNTKLSIDKFPSIALDLYRKTDSIAPNRAINTLGIARSNVYLNQHGIALNLYQQLYFQITSTNNSDENFLKEPTEYIDHHNFTYKFTFSYSLISMSLSFICFIIKC